MVATLNNNFFSDYVRDLRANIERGDATEHTHRPALKSLLEAVDADIVATNEPRRIACGAPDFNITRNGVPVGHIETKDIGVNLDEMERGKGPNGGQFLRYATLPNWVLTDYLEFRWYAVGEKRLTLRVADFDAKGRLKPVPDGAAQLAAFLTAFYTQPALTVSTARDLARHMAGFTRMLRDLLLATLKDEKERQTAADTRSVHETMPGYGTPDVWLNEWLTAFRETLIPDLDEHAFADMFAQTLAYGLFAARAQAPNKPFSRLSAAQNLPRTNPFLRLLFEQIAGARMPDTIAWAVNDMVALLAHADMGEILRDFGKCKGREDPVVHFYETFLAAYDPALRDVRGVYYTPEPVVRYIVRSLDWLLKTRLDRPRGLADENTLILDPATGTGTFLYFAIERIQEAFQRQRGAWDGYVGRHLLPRLFGFELLMAPYAVAHLKLSMQLETTGYTFGSDQRLGIYLTNTLEEAAKRSEMLLGQFISREANAAAEIKRDRPIMVVMGNPPYANFGQMNRNPWILDLLADYKRDLNEKKLNLDDDYIKFIRFAQWRIDQTGHGIVGFITNNSYLDGITHRRMRQSLLESFDEIYVLNLHGSSKKKEKAPDGGKDENVFDITVGTSILLAVKHANSRSGRSPTLQGHDAAIPGAIQSVISNAACRRSRSGILARPGQPGMADLLQATCNTNDTVYNNAAPALARVYHADLWGRRALYEDDRLVGGKYHWLWEHDAETTPWTELTPNEPYHFFVPKDDSSREEYERGWSLREVFTVSGNAVKTERDGLSIHFTKEGIRRVVEDFRSLDENAIRTRYDLHKDSRDWQVVKAKTDITKYREDTCFQPILYRPFDLRHTWYSGQSRGFIGTPAYPVMRHMLAGDNLAVVCLRQSRRGENGAQFVANGLMGKDLVSPYDIGTAFPLYLHPEGAELDISGGRRPNLNLKFIADLEKRLGIPFAAASAASASSPDRFTPEDIFHYAYAILHSPTYRERYAEFLKIDFPRLPLTADCDLFFRLAAHGADLVALHLLQSPKLDHFITDFPEKGTNEIDRVIRGTGILPVIHGRDAHATRGSAGASNELAPSASPEPTGRVHINATQYFGGIPAEVWTFRIGGYQVCEKWLKDRKGRTLDYADLQHYQKIVVALHETIRLMVAIDQTIETQGGWPGVFL